MYKFSVRLLVAATCFALSVSLTNFVKLVRGQGPSVDVLMFEPVGSNVDESQIRQIYREYGPAQTRHDRAFFEEIETDDFTLFSNGMKLSRDEDIQWMNSMPPTLVFENQPQDIRMFGNSAVVNGRMLVRYSNDHVDWWNYIDVWVKRGNAWKIQSTTSAR